MIRADKRKHHYIYKITRIFDGKFYIGMHSTENLEDDYFGSGTRLWYSINKHGKEKHVKEILEYLPDRKSLAAREKELVNKELLEDRNCMNLKVGGDGGTHGKEASVWDRPGFRDLASARLKVTQKKLWEKEEYRVKMKTAMADMYKNGKSNVYPTAFLGKKHSEKTKLQMSASAKGKHLGEKNSSYGTCWVVKENVKPFKIKKEQLDEYISNGYSRGRKNIP